VKLDGKTLKPVALIEKLNAVGGANGIGRLDMIENRLVGIKSREIYEAPGAVILHFAHQELERLTLDKDTSHYKAKIANDYADLIYNGLWFSPLKKALDGFVTETQKNVTGIVRVRLYKGNLTVGGRSSVYSLYDTKLATYTSEDTFDHKSSEGFIRIYGLGLKTFHKVNQPKSVLPRKKTAKRKK
jgi:argininosuccinate synthase